MGCGKGTGAAGAGRPAVESYIRVPEAYLVTPWFRDLTNRQIVVWLELMRLSRIDKSTPDMCVRTSAAAVGRRIGMERSQVLRTIEAMIPKGALSVEVPGQGGRKAVYRLAEPAPLKLEIDDGIGVVKSGANDDGLLSSNCANDDSLPSSFAGSAEKDDDGLLSSNQARNDDSPGGPALHTTKEVDGSTHPSTSVGTGLRMRCPNCGSWMHRTGQMVYGSKRRIWRCHDCNYQQAEPADRSVASEPSYSPARPRGVDASVPVGDR